MQTQSDTCESRIGGRGIEQPVAIAIEIDRAGNLRIVQFAEQIARGRRTRSKRNRVDGILVGPAATGAARCVLAIEELPQRARDGALGHGVAGCRRCEQILETKITVGIGAHREAYVGAALIDATQRDGHALESALPGIAPAVVEVGLGARAAVFVHRAAERGDLLAEPVVEGARRRQARNRHEVVDRTGRAIARRSDTLAIACGLGFAEGIGCARRRAREGEVPVGLGPRRGERHTTAGIAGIEAQQHTRDTTIGGCGIHDAIAVAVDVDGAADIGIRQFAEQVVRRAHASRERDAAERVLDGGAATRAARRVLAVGKYA